MNTSLSNKPYYHSMKVLKILLTSLLLSNSVVSNAQSVNIPDAGFVSFLQGNYPTCMSGSMMDTTCTDIINETSLIIPSSYNVVDLYGVQFFDELDILTVNYHPVTNIPFLPQDLIQLNAAYCQLTTITNLPSTLEKLEITSNNLTSLPPLPSGLITYYRSSMSSLPIETSLPSTVETYYVQQCSVVNLPPLPAGLKALSIGSNPNINIPIFPNGLDILGIKSLNLTSLPPIPNSVTYLSAISNDFTSLTSFPPNLEKLYLNSCSSLTTIQNLPNTLQQLYANDCDLSSIDYLPNSISTLHLHNNNLNSIPNIPNSATTIKLENNNLTALQPLPSPIYTLELANNSLYCVPFLPATISTISLSGNNFTCLPNILPAMSAAFQAYPLCVDNDPIDNPFGCLGSEGVQGYTYMDQNTNCNYEATDVQMKNVPITVYDDLGNTVTSASTYTNGRYYFHLSAGQYNVEVDTTGRPYEVDCLNPGADSSITLNAGTPLISDVNFGLKCKAGFDVGTRSVHAAGLVFPGQPHTLAVKSGDLTNYYNLNCSNGVAGTVTVTVTGPVTFQNVTAGALTPAIAGNVFTYTIADFGNVNPDVDFRLDYLTDTTALAGDLICVNVVVTPNSGDINTVNNNYSTCYPVVNSYDPNNKLVYPSEVEPGYDDYLTYTINFQNTGSAPAFNIRLEDTLSAFLDLSTFEVIDYSHDMHYNLTNNLLKVYYPNIMLVDSTTSEPDSKGYITYRVKSNGNVIDGDKIENTAHIFFDFNTAIVTNTIVTEVELDVTGIDNLDQAIIGIYPNPSSHEYFIVSDENITGVNVFDYQGKLVHYTFDANQKLVDLHDNAPGIYFIQIGLGSQILTKKLIKK